MNMIKGNWLIDFFYPPRCPVCDEILQVGSRICTKCEMCVRLVEEPVCKKCGKPVEDERIEYCTDCQKKHHVFTQGKAVFVYRTAMKQSLYRFKYSNRREYAVYYAMQASVLYSEWVTQNAIEVIVPIPMYSKKQRLRGYNQAEVFAKALGETWNLPVDTRLVKRIKNTIPQKELNDKQRKGNLKKAFQLVPNIVKYRKVLLVDDIYTTGNTMDAVAEVLCMGGVVDIFYICISIGAGF